MNADAHEVNFDALVGPTHNYAGLSYGNVASNAHRGQASNPRAAALEGLAKMKLLAGLGVLQAALPPQDRPDLALLRALGFDGSDAHVLEQAQRDEPALLAACCSASSMWAANSATISPSADTADDRVHITPANLITQLHRSLEPTATALALRRVLSSADRFAHHPPLPGATHLSDEGAANHTRLCRRHGEPGVEVFVFGRRAFDPAAPAPARFPARQTREASAAVARLHGLDPEATVFLQQNPAAIDAGVFHNDVIAVGNQNVLLYHASAFVDGPAAVAQLRRVFERTCDAPLIALEVAAEALTLPEAVASYFFNSQLVTLPDGAMALVCPIECRAHDRARAQIDAIVADPANPVAQAHYIDVRQSMANGGGPACLRLRVVLDDAERAAMHEPVIFTPERAARLTDWVNRHYREELRPDDLIDPQLLRESRAALEELTRILELGELYAFQR